MKRAQLPLEEVNEIMNRIIADTGAFVEVLAF
jgi:hypothetical protein